MPTISACIISFDEEQKKLQYELIEAEKVSTLGKVVAGIAHEINNPATVIQSDLQLLKGYMLTLQRLIDSNNCSTGEFKEISTKMSNVLSRDFEASRRVTDIVKAMKSSYRPGGWHLVDIHKEIDLQLTLLNSKLKNKIKVTKQYGDTAECNVYGSRFGQVMMNLLSNAIDAVPEKGEIFIKTEKIDSFLKITIKDNGPGIPQSLHSKIFDPFYTTKEIGKGTGLGLYISKDIIDNHKGSLSILSSKPGEGAIFEIKLPHSKRI
ncbi:HAMP domain-containing histidine kinase [candidate division KSB1 bacterium]|nr:HAMP domain-containing histidine kinase [candidate division KSB1 bacterium]